MGIILWELGGIPDYYPNKNLILVLRISETRFPG